MTEPQQEPLTPIVDRWAYDDLIADNEPVGETDPDEEPPR